MDYNQTYNYWLQKADKKIKARLTRLSDDMIKESFSDELSFGTGGIRALMGIGSSKLNLVTMQKIALGTANYLIDKNNTNQISVVIAYDNRNNSLRFAKQCATVFASKGIRVILTRGCNPTPYLSFSVRHLKAQAGIMITASHNPKEYNGYKLYDSDGCQLTDLQSQAVSEFIKNADPFNLKTNTFSDYYLKQGIIKINSYHTHYINAVIESVQNKLLLQLNRLPPLLNDSRLKNDMLLHLQLNPRNQNNGELRVAYSPLCGTGGLLAFKILKKSARLIKVEDQLRPDGDFKNAPIPNPENPLAYQQAIILAKQNNADLIIVTDPDADRMGVMVRDNKSPLCDYKFLSGNQIGALLAFFLLSFNQSQKGADNHPSSLVIVRTVVSTPMVDKIADYFNAETKIVLTGFKYIGEAVKQLEKQGRESDFILGFEDSHGFLSGGYVRDKDGLQAALLITELAKMLKASGLTLIDILEELYKKFGYFFHKTISIRLDGENAKSRLKATLDDLRKNGIKDLEVTETKDYLLGIDGLKKTDMLALKTNNGKIIIRPSGTEPLLKIYLTATADTKDACQRILNDYEKLIITILGG